MPETFNTMFQKPEDIILFILAVAVLLVFVGCIYAFFQAIFLFIFSKGADDKVKGAWNSIRYLIIGLFLTIMLLFIGPQLLKRVNMPNAEVYTAKSIFAKIGDIAGGIGELVGIVIRDYPDGNFWSSSSTERDISSTTSYEL